MARRRVLALGPAVSRMMCMNNPYEQIRRGEREGRGRGGEAAAVAVEAEEGAEARGESKRPRRRWGLRVGRLRIRLLSPLALLKRLCDSYVRMMFALENKMGGAGIRCAQGPAFPIYPMPLPGRMGYDFSPR